MSTKNIRLAINLVMVWIVISSVYVHFLYSSRLAEQQRILDFETAALNRILSQRVDQHAAHLTSLSALALAGAQEGRDLFLQVANAVRQYYPRITAIDLVSLQSGQFMLTTRAAGERDLRLSQAIRNQANASSGQLMLSMSPVAEGRYLLVKRSPNSDMARFGLALEIDIHQLIDAEDEYWKQPNTTIGLALPGSGEPMERGLSTDSSTMTLSASKPLSSNTQPLILFTFIGLDAWFLVRDEYLVAGLLSIALALILAAVIVKLILRIRNAEKRARLGENEARIAHASRVNSLGEIASGMAHELNQPLTAILSQSQAGLHLLNRDEPALLEKILKDNVTQAKRADQILSRLRNWTRRGASVKVKVLLKACIDNVIALLESEIKKSGIEVSVQLDKSNPGVLGDPVEVEQVIFNLMKNAIESLRGVQEKSRIIEISSIVTNENIIVEVNDNGPGIAAEIQTRLFEPFASSKEEGMGLGLVICERILERMDASLDLVNLEPEGVSAKIVFPL